MPSRDFVHVVDDGHLTGIERARGYFDAISHAGGELLVSGWMMLPAVVFDSFRLLLDGHASGAAAVTVREDVGQAFPGIPHAHRSGFGFRVTRPRAAIERCRIDIVGLVGDRPAGRLGTLFRPDLDTAVPTPPAELIARVAATPDPMFFKLAGLQSFGEFLAPIARYRPLPSISRLLDWGCGCGRVTAHFLMQPGVGAVDGCDIDREAVAWCAAHLPRGRFQHIDPWPPTAYPDGAFDVVIAFSVFTHLARDVQRAWLQEMERIIVPGGLLLASTHGWFAAAFAGLLDDPRWLRDGIIDEIPDPSLDGIAPRGYYRGVYQSREYTKRQWGKQFEIVEYIDRGMRNFQDLTVMRRLPPRPRFWGMVGHSVSGRAR